MYLPLLNAHIDNHAFIRIVIGVENQRLQRGLRVALGGRDVLDNPLHDLVNVEALLGRDSGRVLGGNADDVLHLVGHPLRVGAGQINFIDDRHQFQTCVYGQVRVGQGLGLNALGGVHHQHGPFTGRQGAGNLVVEVHMAGGIDEVEYIVLPILGTIHQSHSVGLNGNAPLPLQVHVVQELILHVPKGHCLGLL